MKRSCPACPISHKNISQFGSFIRKSDKKLIKRYRCNHCLKTFSQATFQKCYRQKKRKLNPRIKELLCSGVSQRRISKLLKITRVTVARRLIFLGAQARIKNKKDLDNMPMVYEWQFDDQETIEHTKCKPLSVIAAVEKDYRKILGFQVSIMPAKGLLAKVSRKKYGKRPDNRKIGREKLFKEISHIVSPYAEIISDESPHYPRSVRKWFPHAFHKTTLGKRGCVTGQGELKKIGYDPIFSINHTFAMFRANVNRLIRKTWCTTKKISRLEDHLAIYVEYHNNQLTKKIS